MSGLSIRTKILLSTMSIVTLVLIFSSFVTYFLFSYHADTLIESQSREISKQILFNYEVYIESILETANYVQNTSLLLDTKDDYESLQELYLLNSGLKQDIVAMFLFDYSGRKLLGDEIDSRRADVSGEEWFVSAQSDPSIFHFLSQDRTTLAPHRTDTVISISRHMPYTEDGVQKSGVLLVELNFRVIQNLADKTDLGLGGHIEIIDTDDSLIYSSEEPQEITEQGFPAAVSHVLGGMKISIDNTDLFLNINTLSYTRWRIATFINIDHIGAVQRSMLPLLSVLFLISIVFTMLVTSIVSLRISRPVSQLQRIMRRIEDGEIETEISVTGQREIVMLGESFNSMIVKIRGLMNRILTEQREKRKTELRALQNQINPHFLYNSLDSIVWLAEHNRSDEVITAVIALARFFRISISNGATFIPVRSEIEHVRNYLTIQKIRHADKFRYEFDIEESLRDCQVMKLILQPLVENAINHGAGEDNCLISVSGRLEDQQMIFEVSNTGYGLTDAQIERIHARTEAIGDEGGSAGVGLRNVNQRLKLYYGERAGLRLSSVPDEKTIVTVRIPVSLSGETG